MKVLAVTPDASLLLQLLANEIEHDLDLVIEPTLRSGLERLDQAPWSLVFVDSILADRIADVVEQIANAGHRVVLLARSLSVQLVIDALRRGMWDLLRYPMNAAELRDVVARSRAAPMLPGRPSHPSSRRSGGVALVGESPELTTAVELAARTASRTSPVLIVGERGTGKEMLARLLHERGCRRNAPFVVVDCTSTSEVDLFGDETECSLAGLPRRTGSIELASGGTLYLDEVVDLPVPIQRRILRAIQQRQLTRVGGRTPVAIDVRLVAATKYGPEESVAAGRLADEVYYQPALVVLALPPLRDRGDDIRLLANHFLNRGVQEHGWQAKDIADETLSVLRKYPWPGNVRQLFNALGHAMLLEEGSAILPADLPSEVRDYQPPIHHSGSERRQGRERRERIDRRSGGTPLPPLEDVERDHIRRALMLTGGQIGRAADLLGIHRNTLRNKLREFELAAQLQPSELEASGARSDSLQL